MATEREVQEAIARCVSSMVLYHNGKRSRETTTAMVAEVQAAAGWVSAQGWEIGETDERILRPVEGELLARYGHELGVRLTTEFLKAFEGFGTFDQTAPDHPKPRAVRRAPLKDSELR
jgi:hypothetical protein